MSRAAYDRAVQELHQAPLGEFVTTRAELAAKLRAAGDAAGAAELAKRRRPPASAWAVNRLFGQARTDFDDMLAAAARMRRGDLGAAGAYRDALATLRKRAADELEKGGHKASDAVLRRVAGTLAAIAAAGGFEPDPPGALVGDLEPPGFDALDAAAPPRRTATIERAAAARAAKRTHESDAARAREERRAAARAEKERQARERARRKERARLEAALRTARATLAAGERVLASLAKKVRAAEESIRDARAEVAQLERKLREVG